MKGTPFLKRLPLLMLVALGVWWWQSSGPPKSRALEWAVPAAQQADVSSLEIEIRSPEGLVKREEFFFADGGASSVRQEATLPDGTFEATLYFKRRSGAVTAWKHPFVLGREDWVSLSPSPAR